MGRFLKGYVWPLLAAILITTLIAVIFQTQRVIAMMQNIGGELSVGDRLSMSLYDIRHLGSLYIIFITIGLGIGLMVAQIIHRKFSGLGSLLFVGAGAVAIFMTLFWAKKAFFDVQIIAGARDGFGMALQMLAGAIGGYVFYRLKKRQL